MLNPTNSLIRQIFEELIYCEVLTTMHL